MTTTVDTSRLYRIRGSAVPAIRAQQYEIVAELPSGMVVTHVPGDPDGVTETMPGWWLEPVVPQVYADVAAVRGAS